MISVDVLGRVLWPVAIRTAGVATRIRSIRHSIDIKVARMQ